MSHLFFYVLDRFPSVEMVTEPLQLDNSFSLFTFSTIFEDLFYCVPFTRGDFHLLNLWSVKPTLYGVFHGFFQNIPSYVVGWIDSECFFSPIRFIPSVESFLGSKYSGFLTFFDRDMFFYLFFSLKLFRGHTLIQS